MASNGSSANLADTESSLEKIKRQLTSGSGRHLLQGPLLKRSETLRKWNERWLILDPTTGKMEYKIRRNEPIVKGTILFDSGSTITLSPVNFQYRYPTEKGILPLCRNSWCCASMGIHFKLVLKAHKEAVSSLGGSGSAKLGTVASVVAAANATAVEASKEIEAAMKISLRAALGSLPIKANEGHLDDLSIMKFKACLSDSKHLQVSGDNVQLITDGVDIRTVGDDQWNDFQSSDPEAEGTSLDIPVVTLPVDDHQPAEKLKKSNNQLEWYLLLIIALWIRIVGCRYEKLFVNFVLILIILVCCSLCVDFAKNFVFSLSTVNKYVNYN
ncbi:hypothetical protein M5K25_014854 [Dendrobium thyrsiflorum]|uniref:PH domain-containing protein n=1 Tax=Dendrobium thyrsiflorum TaxID=117978 RepID=A0ABD0UPF6_DENTH